MEICRKCGIELNDENRYLSTKKSHSKICKICDNKKSLESYYLHKEKRRKQQNEYNKIYYSINRKQCLEDGKSRQQKRRQIILNHYSNNTIQCACCGEKEIKFLSIDHINNDGAAHKKEIGGFGYLYTWIIKNNFPEDFQVLCMNCNFGKRMNGGICPHKEAI